MADEIGRIIDTLNQQKGELLALRVLLYEILEALPLDGRVRVLTHFDQHREEMLATIAFGPIPEEVLTSYRKHSEAIATRFAETLRKSGFAPPS